MVLLTKDYPELHQKIQILLSEKPEILNTQSKTGCTALLLATMFYKCCSTKETIEILLDHGADINIANINGDLPIYIAAELYHDDLYKLLETYQDFQ